MFAVISRGVFTKEAFMKFLEEVGLIDQCKSIIDQVQRLGRLQVGKWRFMLVR